MLVDNYIDETTLTMLSKRNANVSATIYTRQLNHQQQLDVHRHNQQYPSITINTCQHNHDRFLIIDDVVYLFGASLKDAGKNDMEAQIKEAAQATYTMYKGFIDAGFNENQAMALILEIVGGSIH